MLLDDHGFIIAILKVGMLNLPKEILTPLMTLYHSAGKSVP